MKDSEAAKTAKEIQVNVDKARTVGKSLEFLATFITLGVFLFIFNWGKFVAFLAPIIAYLIVNGVLEVYLKGIKQKLSDLLDKIKK